MVGPDDPAGSEVAVLGGGPAGASAALRLARAGARVQLFERQAGPHHKVCGEFLSVEAQRDLRDMAFEPLRLGAVAIDRVRLVNGRSSAESRLPFTGLGVSRLLLDEALLEAAEAAGAEVRRGVKVIGLDAAGMDTSAGRFDAPARFLATGKHDIRGAGREPAGGGSSGYVGFKMHWRITPEQDAALGNAVELVFVEGGYLGLQRVAARVMNFCVLVRKDRFGGSWSALLAELGRDEHVARRLDGASELFERPCSIAGLPYGYVHRPSEDRDGLFRLGDQAVLTAPLTGDGMAIALRSAALAVEAWLAGLSSADYTRRLRREVAPQVRKAMALHRVTGLPIAARLASGLLGLWPPLLGRLAAATRLRESASR
ncbi:flavin-dependent dehydrogenase [Novosphingobium sp. PhB57]|uniref:NAD(P)/FAD-dependent oxidoreductase n=1 Tax=Novosphingobium sp. PhB57 TaxID=2485107 RepID=UPI00104B1D40|nr:FAD-dependent monooxygenase [Novosphingobium sp. PhB57]TCU57369.1 flavin-dependent dehydrogenase [Novosphingobium sp. PhB57]